MSSFLAAVPDAAVVPERIVRNAGVLRVHRVSSPDDGTQRRLCPGGSRALSRRSRPETPTAGWLYAPAAIHEFPFAPEGGQLARQG